jgi:hypothetical protein
VERREPINFGRGGGYASPDKGELIRSPVPPCWGHGVVWV